MEVRMICASMNFYPRSPCGERRSGKLSLSGIRIFLSTLSLRRATLRSCPASSPRRYFYPRSPCGERQSKYCPVSVHERFLSTLSLRRATDNGRLLSADHFISIHALLAESDPKSWPWPPKTRYFYPRSPCGERQYLSGVMTFGPGISIHALLAESDWRTYTKRSTATEFLSTLSLRRATPVIFFGDNPKIFLSTLSLRRAT